VADDGAIPVSSLLPDFFGHTSSDAVDNGAAPQGKPVKEAPSRKEVPAADDNTSAPWQKRNPSVSADETSESGNNGDSSVVANDEKNTEKTPALSSVPPNPPVFSDIKQDSKPRLEELHSEQAKAQEEKAALMAEPSQQRSVAEPSQPQDKAVPEVVPLAEKSVPAVEAPVTTAVDSVPTAPSAPQGTPLRGVDIMTQAEWDALHKAHQEEAPAAPTPPATPVEVPAN